MYICTWSECPSNRGVGRREFVHEVVRVKKTYLLPSGEPNPNREGSDAVTEDTIRCIWCGAAAKWVADR